MKIINPNVSIILLTRNNIRTIKQCLDSLINQKYDNFEIIINDANSTDGTYEILTKYCNFNSNIKLLQKNNDMSEARNIANKIATGTYVFHVDSDMAIPKDFIQCCIDFSQINDLDALIIPEYGVGKTFWQKCKVLEKSTIRNDPNREAANRFMLKDVYEEAGGWPVGMLSGADFHFYQKIISLNYKVGRINTTKIYHLEILSFYEMIKKYYLYGYHFNKFNKIYSTRHSINHFNFFSPFFFRNWFLLLNNPILTIGLLVLRIGTYASSAAGYIVSQSKR